MGEPTYIHTGDKFTLKFGRSNGRCDGSGGRITIRFSMLNRRGSKVDAEYDDFFIYDNRGTLSQDENASNPYGGPKKLAGTLKKYGKATDRKAAFYVYKTPRIRNDAPAPKEVVMRGTWKRVNICQGSLCEGIEWHLTVGVSKSHGITSATASSESLSLMVGAEVKTSTGALPGGEVTAKYELTGTVSQERSREIADSFTMETSSTSVVKCKKNSALWQWVSTLHITSATDGKIEVIKAPSSISKCTAPNEKPPKTNDITWSPKGQLKVD